MKFFSADVWTLSQHASDLFCFKLPAT